jgi:DNA-binding NtrC family response regulator
MATILVVGSHPVVTRHVTEALRAEGWQAIPAVGAQAGLRAIAQHDVDAMVVGGPTALAERNRLESRLRERNRWAPVVVPDGVEDAVAAVERAFAGEAH